MANCASCNFEITQGWKYCPMCATEVPSGFAKFGKIAGAIGKSAGSTFQGIYQLQRGNIGGAVSSFGNAASGVFKQESSSGGDASPIARASFSCPNPACNFTIDNVKNQNSSSILGEKCPSCNTPLNRDISKPQISPDQPTKPTSSTGLPPFPINKVHYVCMASWCKHQIGPVPKSSSPKRCSQCGEMMKIKTR